MKDIVIAAVLFLAITEVALAHNVDQDHAKSHHIHVQDGDETITIRKKDIHDIQSSTTFGLPRVTRKRCDYNDAISGPFCNIVYNTTRKTSNKVRYKVERRINRKIDKVLEDIL